MQTTNPSNTPGDLGPLSHPTREEWMGYLYCEVSSTESARMKSHLDQCAACRNSVESWKSAARSLDDWKLPETAPQARPRRLGPKWAVAAAIVFGVSIGLAGGVQLASNTRQVANLRQEMRTEMQGELMRQRQEILTQVAGIVQQRGTEDRRAVLALLRDVSETHRADYAALHKDLETMAILTETGFQEAQQQIVHLASSASPGEPNQ